MRLLEQSKFLLRTPEYILLNPLPVWKGDAKTRDKILKETKLHFILIMNYSEKLTRWMLEDTLTRYPAFDIQNEIKELLDLGVLMIFVFPDKKKVELKHRNLNLKYVLEDGTISKIETLDAGSLTKNLISLLEGNLNQFKEEDENIYTAIYKKYISDIAEIYKGLEDKSKTPNELNKMMIKLMQKITSDFIKAKIII